MFGSPGEIRTPVDGSKAHHACPLQSAKHFFSTGLNRVSRATFTFSYNFLVYINVTGTILHVMTSVWTAFHGLANTTMGKLSIIYFVACAHITKPLEHNHLLLGLILLCRRILSLFQVSPSCLTRLCCPISLYRQCIHRLQLFPLP